MADFILPEADRIFEKLQSENYLKDKPIDQFADSIAELAMDLNALHPFREGNGRTIRLFLQLLAGNAGFLIDYDIVSHEDLIEVDKQAFLGNDKPIREMYRAIIAVIK